ncbi:MAG TPA: FixH family protein, partial [bacterium]|nr:FixH family protein [bacterium]
MKQSLIAILGCLVVATSACGGGGAKNLDTSRTEKSSGGTYEVTYAPSPDPIPVNQPFAIDVTIKDGSGAQLITDASIAVAATMPDMNMGMPSPPTIATNGSGSFVATGMYFSMSGHWVLDIAVTKASATEHAKFNIV